MRLLFFFAILVWAGCQSNDKPASLSPEQLAQVPAWTHDAIWYQIFVERFRNGDPANDPTLADIQGSYPGYFPPDWQVTPWTQQWYQKDPWFAGLKDTTFYGGVSARRYGGDLQGVIDRLDYLQQLGINAIYFNPLNDAPSLHKYDAAHYHHIDRNFGPDPQGDAAIMAAENPADPATWQWTAADKLFLQLLRDCHQRGIRVVMDYSWNHTGARFWAFEDVKKKGKQSAFADWYHILREDDPATPESEFDYEGWVGVKDLPVFQKDITDTDGEMPFEGNLRSASLKAHIFDVTRRWLDPNADGDPSDGVDGYRLDVAAEVPMGFWAEYRKVVRTVNPDAYLIGEIWWKKWPYELMDPRPFLQGDQFDAIMNYRWYRPVRGFFAQSEPIAKPSQLVAELQSLNENIAPERVKAMMNMSASHDSPRLATSFFNKTYYKYLASPSANRDYRIDRPDSLTWQAIRMFWIHAFTYLGAPQIWNGDEVGMWGADDPECRKPIVWADLAYETETAHPLHLPRPANEVKPDLELYAFLGKLAHIRKTNPALVHGDIQFSVVDDARMALAYHRTLADDEVIVAFNRSAAPVTLEIAPKVGQHFYDPLQEDHVVMAESGLLHVALAPMQAVILIKK